MSAALELRGVTKSYPPPNQVTALDAVDLVIATGDTVAITGASGSGKSTLLSVLGTLERPSTGKVLVAGEDTSGMSERELSGVRAWQIGFVFQRFFLLDHLSVLENVARGLLYRGPPAPQRRIAAAAALVRVGLAERTHHRPFELSGGERQRVAIARAVVGHPRVVLADEPTGNLDSVSGAAITALLATLADLRTTVVVVTHDVDVAATLRRHVTLPDGRVVSDTGTELR